MRHGVVDVLRNARVVIHLLPIAQRDYHPAQRRHERRSRGDNRRYALAGHLGNGSDGSCGAGDGGGVLPGLGSCGGRCGCLGGGCVAITILL
jgi:hypothetical protein